jgi:hypothetical protein
MAFFVALLAGLGLFGPDANKNETTQTVVNSLNFETINSILVQNNATTRVNVTSTQSFTFSADGCTVGNVNITQLNNTGVNVVNIAALELNADIINQITVALKNVLDQTFNREDIAGLQFLDIFQKATETTQTLENTVTAIIQNEVTASNLAAIQSSIFQTQTNTITCKNSDFEDVTINQQLIVNVVLKNVAQNVTNVVLENTTISDIVNDANQEVSLENKSLLDTGAIVGIVIAVVVVVVVVAVLIWLGTTGKLPLPGAKKKGSTNITIQTDKTPTTPTPKTPESAVAFF